MTTPIQRLKLVSGPQEQPVTLQEAKAYLSIADDDNSKDGLVSSLTIAATEKFEELTGRRLIEQTHDMFLAEWPAAGNPKVDPDDMGDYIELPYGELSSITYIKYRDTNGDWQTWSSDDYDVQNGYEPGRVYLAYNISWPTSVLYPGYSIQIRFVCGTSPVSISESMKMCIKYLISELFINRAFEPVYDEFFMRMITPHMLSGLIPGVYSASSME
jgi:uncharacterized phiE125 gp8 family phage protein